MGVFASVYSLAMTDAIVAAGEKSDLVMTGELPINMVTAIVSPNALPNPKTIALVIPDNDGVITCQVLSFHTSLKPGHKLLLFDVVE